MGIFSSKKKTYVTSVAYPLGEDDGDHVPFLQSTVLNAILQRQNIAESITRGYLSGQGISLRSAFRYARDHYIDGIPKSDVAFSTVPDIDELQTILEGFHPGAVIEIINSKVSSADYMWWGDQYLAENYGYNPYTDLFASPPPGVDVDAAVAYDVETNGDIIVLMQNADTSIVTETFTPVGLVRMADYVHVSYTADAGLPIFWMYQIGLGTYPVLDTWIASEDLVSPYFPSIPLRVNNVDFTDEAHQDTDLYKSGKKLLKRVGVDIEDLAEQVNENESIDDIDYAYVVFGVNLNAKSQESKRYLYRFFQHLLSVSQVTETDFAGWNPADGTTPPTNILKIFSTEGRDRHHDIELQWQYINTSIHSGTVAPGAKPKDVEVLISGSRDEVDLGADIVLDKSLLLVRRQVDADTYVQLEITGLTFENFVYNGKSVIISAYDALTDEEEEGFILPLSYELLRNTPLVELTDLSYQCNHIVFNCYQIVKEKWYQSGWFKIILVIIAIIITVFTWGADGGSSLGYALSYGAAVALVGVSALTILLAATIYVLGMIVLMSLLSKIATKAFGETWGAIIAMVAMFLAMNWGNLTAMASSASANGLSSIITAQNLMQATTLLANAYGTYAAAQMGEMQRRAMGLWTEFDEQMKEIERLTELNLDTNTDLIDIQGFTNATFVQMFESSDTFFQRTLLTGSDICAITSGMIENFAEVGIRLPTTG